MANRFGDKSIVPMLQGPLAVLSENDPTSKSEITVLGRTAREMGVTPRESSNLTGSDLVAQPQQGSVEDFASAVERAASRSWIM